MSQAVSIQSCLQNKNIMGALKHAELWVIHEKENADAWFWRGTVQVAGNLEEEAINSWKKSLELQPNHMGSAYNLSLAFLKKKKFEDVCNLLEATLKIIPNNGQLHTLYAHALASLDRQDQALIHYQKVFELNGYDPNLLHSAALCARDIEQPKLALDFLNKELETRPHHPQALFEKACMEFTIGNYTQAFTDYEARWLTGDKTLPELEMPFWLGEDLSEKHIVIFDEQGIGDTLMCARFLPYILKKAKKVTLQLRPALHGLFEDFNPDLFITSPKSNIQADYQCAIMSLPLRLGFNTIDQLKATEPYIKPKSKIIEKWSKHDCFNTSLKKIGLIWQGNPNSPAERGRSLSFKDYLPYLKDNRQYYILQCYDGRDELQNLKLPENVIDLGNILDKETGAFEDTAAVMHLLDHVITTDTGPAHLAGALGVPTSIILKTAPEWRWGIQGKQTIWYPTISLYRHLDIQGAFIGA